MFSYRTAMFLVFVSSICAYDNYGGVSPNQYVSPDTCLQQGTQCSKDCTAVLYCSYAGASPITSIDCTLTNQNCFSDYTDIATCSSTNSDCATAGQLDIKCREAGNFPDPYNCRNSYTCENNNLKPTEECLCPPGSIWGGPLVDCNTDPINFQACCQDFEVDCKNTNIIGGNFGACWLTALGYYYICERDSGSTSISLHKCPEGQLWNATSYKCEAFSDLFYLPKEEKINHDQKPVKMNPVCESLSSIINQMQQRN